MTGKKITNKIKELIKISQNMEKKKIVVIFLARVFYIPKFIPYTKIIVFCYVSKISNL